MVATSEGAFLSSDAPHGYSGRKKPAGCVQCGIALPEGWADRYCAKHGGSDDTAFVADDDADEVIL
jgi:hypothetical protein